MEESTYADKDLYGKLSALAATWNGNNFSYSTTTTASTTSTTKTTTSKNACVCTGKIIQQYCLWIASASIHTIQSKYTGFCVEAKIGF